MTLDRKTCASYGPFEMVSSTGRPGILEGYQARGKTGGVLTSNHDTPSDYGESLFIPQILILQDELLSPPRDWPKR